MKYERVFLALDAILKITLSEMNKIEKEEQCSDDFNAIHTATRIYQSALREYNIKKEMERI